jgi:hypothetical protein
MPSLIIVLILMMIVPMLCHMHSQMAEGTSPPPILRQRGATDALIREAASMGVNLVHVLTTMQLPPNVTAEMIVDALRKKRQQAAPAPPPAVISPSLDESLSTGKGQPSVLILTPFPTVDGGKAKVRAMLEKLRWAVYDESTLGTATTLTDVVVDPAVVLQEPFKGALEQVKRRIPTVRVLDGCVLLERLNTLAPGDKPAVRAKRPREDSLSASEPDSKRDPAAEPAALAASLPSAAPLPPSLLAATPAQIDPWDGLPQALAVRWGRDPATVPRPLDVTVSIDSLPQAPFVRIELSDEAQAGARSHRWCVHKAEVGPEAAQLSVAMDGGSASQVFPVSCSLREGRITAVSSTHASSTASQEAIAFVASRVAQHSRLWPTGGSTAAAVEEHRCCVCFEPLNDQYELTVPCKQPFAGTAHRSCAAQVAGNEPLPASPPLVAAEPGDWLWYQE